jgi:hypothetical protein
MAIAAVAALAVAEVTLRTMKTKMAVRTVSKMNAPPTPMLISDALPQPSVPRPVIVLLYLGEVLNVPHSASAPTIPPANWAIQ